MKESHSVLPIILLLICVAPLNLLGATQARPIILDSINSNTPDSIICDTLQEVIVSAELLKRRGNEDIITVTKSMRDGTKNTGELLGRISGVFYNPMTTDLQYMGSKNILVLVDGVEKNPDYIKRLNPERFDRIKVINMPTGIYAGYDAVIDLHTKPLYVGHEGVILSETVLATNNRNGVGKDFRKSRTAGQFTYTREKLNIDFITDYTFEQQGVSDYFERVYPLNDLTESTLEYKENRPNKNNRISRYFADLAIDYDFNEYHSLSAKISIAPSSNKENYNYLFKRSFANLNLTDTVSETRTSNISGRLDVLAGLWYRGSISAWKLNAYVTYNHIGYKWYNAVLRNSGYKNINNRNVLSKYFTGGVETNRYSNNQKWIFSLSDNFILSDYSENRLETGNRLSNSTDFRNTFNGSVQFQGNKKFSMGVNAGLSIFRNSYNGKSDTHITPKAGIQMMWFPSKNVLLRLNYAMTTQYPPLSLLQNYGQFTDSLMYTAGNPQLRPSLNHEVSLSATLFRNFTVEGRFTHSSNSIFEYYTSEVGEIPSGLYTYFTKSEAVNGTKNSWSINLTYAKLFGKHWQVSFTGKVIGHSAKYNNVHSSKILPEYSWYVLYQIMNGSWQFYLSGYMQSYSLITPQSNQWSLDDAVALSISKTFFKNKLQILGMWYLPIHFSDGKWHGGVNSKSFKTHYWADNQFRKNNMFQISIIYKFNGGQSVKKYNRSSGTVEI